MVKQKSRKYKFLLSLGGASSVAFLPLAVAVACDDSTSSQTVKTDAQKIEAAKTLFAAQELLTQKVSASIDSAIEPGPTTAERINAITGLTRLMPDVSSTGANVSYVAEAPVLLTQVIKAAITAGSAIPAEININLTFEPHVLTDGEKVARAFSMFDIEVTAQNVTATVDHPLPIDRAVLADEINNLGLAKDLPDVSTHGASIIYNAGALNNLTQVVTATITAGLATPIQVPITLTYAPRIETDSEKITNALKLFALAGDTQILTTEIGSALSEHETDPSRINAVLVRPLPNNFPAGLTVSYAVGAVDLSTRGQVITAHLQVGNETGTAQITLTYAEHVLTDTDKVIATQNLFKKEITMQSVAETAAHALQPGAVTVAMINQIPGLTSLMPTAFAPGVKVTYVANAISNLNQTVIATISSGNVSASVAITLIYLPSISDTDKMLLARNLFSSDITTQILLAKANQALATTVTDPATINTVLNKELPTSFPNGVNVTYHVGEIDKLTRMQIVIATLNVGLLTETELISLTYAPYTLTDVEKISAAVSAFGPEIVLQTTTTQISSALSDAETDPINIDAVLTNALPKNLPDGVSVSYAVSAADALMRIQIITAHLQVGSESASVTIKLTYAQHVPTDLEQINTAARLFTTQITTQSLTTSVNNALSETVTDPAFINTVLITPLPANLPSGVSVYYTVAAVDISSRLQVVTAHLQAGFEEQSIAINLTYAERMLSDQEKVALAKLSYTSLTLNQTLQIEVSQALDPSITDLTTINSILATKLPTNLPTDVSASYTVSAVNQTTREQIMIITLIAGTFSDTVSIILTYIPHVTTDEELVAQAKTAYTNAMQTQSATRDVSQALLPSDNSLSAINSVLTTALPTSLTNGVSATYQISTVDLDTRTQIINVTLSLNAAIDIVTISLIYPPRVLTDSEKITLAELAFTNDIITQVSTTQVTNALDVSVTDLAFINTILVNPLPAILPHGVSVSYTVAALNSTTLEQIITAHLSVGIETSQVLIHVTYAPHVPTDQEIVEEVMKSYSSQMRTQTLTTEIGNALSPLSTSDVTAINNVLVVALPTTVRPGVSVTYNIAAVNQVSREQIIIVSITSHAFTDTFLINLTYAEHVTTNTELLDQAEAAYITVMRTQTLTAEVADALTTSDNNLAAINGKLVTPLPTTFPTGVSASYTVAAVDQTSREQIITVHLITNTETRDVTITLTYASHVLTPQELMDIANALFTDDIKTQTLTTEIIYALDTTENDPSVINTILVKPLPEIMPSGVTVSYTVAAANQTSREQVIIAHLETTGASPVTKDVTITVTYAEHIVTDEEKVGIMMAQYSQQMRTQTLTTEVGNALASTVTDLSAINAVLLVHLPTNFPIDVNATYSLSSVNQLTREQIIIVTITSGTFSDTVLVTLTYAPHVMTDAERVATAKEVYTNMMQTQSSTTDVLQALLPADNNISAINNVLSTPLPTSLPNGVSATYAIGVVNTDTRAQIITVTLNLNGVTDTVSIVVVYAPHIPTDLEKVKSAAALFTTEIMTQTLTTEIGNALDVSATDPAFINTVLMLPLPSDFPSGVSVSYTVSPVNSQTREQEITAHITSGSESQDVTIRITYAEHVPTDQELLIAASALYTGAMRTQTLTTEVSNALSANVTDLIAINSILATSLPTTLPGGVNASYTVTAVDQTSRIQLIVVSLTTSTFTDTVLITLTYAEHILTDTEKVAQAKMLYSPQMLTQTSATDVVNALGVGVSDLAAINAILSTPLPLSLPDGIALTYQVGALNTLTRTQIITITLGLNLVTDTVSISVTYAEHIPTDLEKLTTAASLFTDEIRTQILPMEVVNALSSSETDPARIDAALVNKLPLNLPIGVTAEYTVNPVNFVSREQIIDVRLLSGLEVQSLQIHLTYAEHVLTDEEKVNLAKNEFTSAMRTQTLTTEVTSALSPGVTGAATINATLAVTLPISLSNDVIATYTVVAVNQTLRTQVIIVALTSNAFTDTVLIHLTYAEHVPTETELIAQAKGYYTSAMQSQTLTTEVDHALTPTDNNLTTINNLLVTLLPTTLPSGVSASYTISPVNQSTLTQIIIVTLTYATFSDSVLIHLTYAPHVPTAAERLLLAEAQYSPAMRTQTLTAEISNALQTSDNNIAAINAVLVTFLPEFLPAGVIASYIVSAANLTALTQVVTVHLVADTATSDVTINLTYAPHVLTAQELFDLSSALFTTQMQTQTLTTQVDHALETTVTDVLIIDGVLITPLPSSMPSGVTVSYSVGAVNQVTREQIITAHLVATAASGTVNGDVLIHLTYAEHVVTDQERVDDAKRSYTLAMQTQTLTTSIDNVLATSVTDVHIINSVLAVPLPTVLPSGVTASYTVGPSDQTARTQDIIVTLTHGTFSDAVLISLTYAPHVITDAERLTDAQAMFTNAICVQTVTQSIDNPLPTGGVSASAINSIVGLTHLMPDISSTGATVSYVANAISGLNQTINATIVVGLLNAVINIVLTYGPHVPTDAEKVTNAVAMFSNDICTQTVTQSIDNPLATGPVTAMSINNLVGLTHLMPDVSGTGATVSYVAASPNNLTQTITATVTSGSSTQTVTISITYGPRLLTDAEKITAASAQFTNAIKTQTLTLKYDYVLAASVTNEAQIDAVLVNKLPVITNDATVTYQVQTGNAATLTQRIVATISSGSATPAVVNIDLTYTGMTLADFKATYPEKISTDGTTIVVNAFVVTTLPASFALPYTVTTIDVNAFWLATLPTGFKLPPSITSIGAQAFSGAQIPAGFTIPNGVIALSTGAFSNTILPLGFSLPSTLISIGDGVFSAATLPAGFNLPASITAIPQEAFLGVILPAGFNLPATVTSIGAAAFKDATLPAGFTIPAGATIVATDSGSIYASFKGAFLQTGYEWHNAQGITITDQTRPTPGCVVAPIAR